MVNNFYVIAEEGQYCGALERELGEKYRIEMFDALTLFGGLFLLSGELKEFDKSVCRIFNDLDSMAIALKPLLARMRESA